MNVKNEPLYRERPDESDQWKHLDVEAQVLQLETNWSRLLHCDILGADVAHHRPAGNDPGCEEPAMNAAEIERRAAHARAANGLGDAVVGDGRIALALDRYAPGRATRAAHSSAFGHVFVAMIAWAGALARQARARLRERRRRKAIHDALSPLDDRTLHDLGITRGEITSLASEVTGRAERTRMRALMYPKANRVFVEREPA